jgi:hypothetical protein
MPLQLANRISGALQLPPTSSVIQEFIQCALPFSICGALRVNMAEPARAFDITQQGSLKAP